MNEFIFIINPSSGNGKAKRVWRKLNNYLEEREIPYRSYMTEYRGHAEVVARQVASLEKNDASVIIGVGGDGTIHEILNGLREFPKIRIGFIAAGTGNDFRRGFGLYANPLKNLKKILSEASHPPAYYDIGIFQANTQQSRLFINSLGAGFDAYVAMLANQMKFKKWLNSIGLGSVTYAAALIAAVCKYKPVSLDLKVDDEAFSFQTVWFAAVSNHPYYGGGMKISPNADPKSDDLSIVVVHDLSRVKLLALFITVFFGKHTLLKEVKVFTGRKVTLFMDPSVPVHADGEASGITPLEIGLHPQKAQIYT